MSVASPDSKDPPKSADANETNNLVKPDQQTETVVIKKKKKKGKEDLSELKKEVQMDEHKIPLDELIQRLETDVSKVGKRMLMK